jgi:hypothetical protein
LKLSIDGWWGSVVFLIIFFVLGLEGRNNKEQQGGGFRL